MHFARFILLTEIFTFIHYFYCFLFFVFGFLFFPYIILFSIRLLLVNVFLFLPYYLWHRSGFLVNVVYIVIFQRHYQSDSNSLKSIGFDSTRFVSIRFDSIQLNCTNLHPAQSIIHYLLVEILKISTLGFVFVVHR